MSNTYNSAATSPDVTDAPFAAVPVWDRPRKRRGVGRAPSAPSDTAALAPAVGTGFGVGPSIADTEPAGPPVTTADIAMRRREAAGRGPPKGMIAAGVLALAAAGGAGWYFTHDGERMAAITPGTLQVAEVAPPVSQAAPPMIAQPPAIPNADPREAVNPPPIQRAAKASPKRTQAAARSAATSAADASAAAALPDAPQPYAPSAGSPAPPTLAVTPPVAPEPAPEPVTAAPQVTPE